MKYIKTFNELITEKKLAVVNISTAARVRNAIFDAMSDGILSEEELNNILGEIKAHKSWVKRNIKLFNITEDGEGNKQYSLSRYGKKIQNVIIKNGTINESLYVPHKNQGVKDVNIFIGRFQPFTLNHIKIFEQLHKKNKLPVVVLLLNSSTQDINSRPFEEATQQLMFGKLMGQYSFLESMFMINDSSIDTIFATLRPTYEPIIWGFTSDKTKRYNSMINDESYRLELDVNDNFEGFELDDIVDTSIKVRTALIIDDEESFKLLVPESLHTMYLTLQDELAELSENANLNPNMNVNNMGPVTFPSNPESMNNFYNQNIGSGDYPFDDEEDDEDEVKN